MFSSCNGVNGCWWMFYLHIIHTGSTSSPKKTIARRIRWRCPLVSLPHRSISRPLVCKFQALGNALLFQGVFGKQTVGPRWRDVTFSSSHGFLLDNDVTIWIAAYQRTWVSSPLQVQWPTERRKRNCQKDNDNGATTAFQRWCQEKLGCQTWLLHTEYEISGKLIFSDVPGVNYGTLHAFK